MPIDSTSANKRGQVHGEAQRRHQREGADDRHRHGGRRHQHGAPVLQEHQDDDQHQHAGLDQRLVNLVDRGVDEARGVERNVPGQALREAVAPVPASWRARWWRPPARWRPATGRWRCPPPAGRSRGTTASRSARPVPPAPRPSPGSTARPIRPPPSRRCCRTAAGSVRRPSTFTVYWNAWPAGAGGVPTWPPVTCWLCCWIA